MPFCHVAHGSTSCYKSLSPRRYKTHVQSFDIKCAKVFLTSFFRRGYLSLPSETNGVRNKVDPALSESLSFQIPNLTYNLKVCEESKHILQLRQNINLKMASVRGKDMYGHSSVLQHNCSCVSAYADLQMLLKLLLPGS